MAAVVGGLCLTAGAGAASAQTVTFLSTGAEQTFTVPEGVTSIRMVAIGGRGGDGSPNGAAPGGSGGFGATVAADIAVTPGQTLFVEVAGNGGSAASGGAGGFNGGGEGGDGPSYSGGGGGGASDVRLGPRAAGTSLSSRLIVAGGGGGGGGGSFGPGSPNGGGHGGSPATGGEGVTGGAPGTATEGGEGSCAEADGGLGTGGAGGTYDRCGYMGYGGGGGGGGGLFGGAGGSFSSAGNGGGGGSSGFPLGGATNTSIGTDSTGSPSISFTFTPGVAAAPVIPPSAAAPVVPAAAPDQCVVPKLGGRKLKGARKGLGAAHCKLGNVTRRKRGAKRVVSQSPKPGRALPAGSPVSVTLGS